MADARIHAQEVWIIEITAQPRREEAAGHSGGRRGKGGDLLYRWGNPRTYRGGTAADQRLFFPDMRRTGFLQAFRAQGTFSSSTTDRADRRGPLSSRGRDRPSGNRSSGDYTPDSDGKYKLRESSLWSYTAPNKIEFFAMLLSGAQRLPNGNTLICSGMSGTIFEVSPEKEVVWRYTCPVPADGGQGRPGVFSGFGPPGGSSLFRAYRYGPDYPGLAGKDLKPQKTVEGSTPRRPRADSCSSGLPRHD